MKKYRYKFLILFFIPLFWGCDKFLEEIPDNRVELNNLQKAAQLLTNAYSTAGYNFTEWMSDNVSYTFGTTKQAEHNEAYTWSEVTAIFQDTPTFYWNQAYEAIAHANEVLAVVDELPGDDERRRAVKGEALLTRAYHHFMLVNLFAKHYDSRTAARDLGIPYVEEPERNFIKQYKRNTVREVYQKIERDLLQGLELVNDRFYANTGKYHFTRNAALAFASRFYLFKDDYQKCATYSTQLLGNSPENHIKDLRAILSERLDTEDFIRRYTSPNDDSNLMLMRVFTNFHVNVGFWLTRDTNTLNPDFSQFSVFRSNPFGSSDERFDNAMFVRGQNGLSAPKFEFLFERSSLTSNVGYNYTITLAFRGEEVLLNRAEANVMLNNLNAAVADMEAFINSRYTNSRGNPITLDLNSLGFYYRDGNNQPAPPRMALLYLIIDERQKEFIHEGLRWFDIKRFGISVRHNLEDGTIIDLMWDDPRQVLQIPKAAIDVGGLEPNDRPVK